MQETTLGEVRRKDTTGSTYCTCKGPDAVRTMAKEKDLKEAIVAQGQTAKENEP